MLPPKYKPGDPITSGTLYRRIYPDQGCFKDGLPTSQVFRPKRNDPGLSAHLAEVTTPDDVLAGFERFGLAEVPVKAVTEAGLSVRYDPIENMPGHVIIEGNNLSRPSTWRKLKQAATLVREPTIS